MKRLQIVLTEESWAAVESLAKDANENFTVGTVNYSDAINEMIVHSKVDIKALQTKHTDLRRAIRALASQGEIDLDSAIKGLMDIKSKQGRKSARTSTSMEEVG